jgi:hypothetical protein
MRGSANYSIQNRALHRKFLHKMGFAHVSPTARCGYHCFVARYGINVQSFTARKEKWKQGAVATFDLTKAMQPLFRLALRYMDRGRFAIHIKSQ